MEGSVDILTSDGLRLSRLSKDEIFGETRCCWRQRELSLWLPVEPVSPPENPKNYLMKFAQGHCGGRPDPQDSCADRIKRAEQ